jgi:hypothetical protein
MIINRIPNRTVNPPKTINMTLQLEIAISASPSAYMRIPPTIWLIPFIEIHVATRIGCSCERYHFDVRITKAGDTAAW